MATLSPPPRRSCGPSRRLPIKRRVDQELNCPLLPQPSLPRSSVIVVGLVAGGARAVAVPCAVPGVAIRAAHCRALHRRRDVAPPGPGTTVHGALRHGDTLVAHVSRKLLSCPREQRCATREAPHSGSLQNGFRAKQGYAPAAYGHNDARLLTEAAPHEMCHSGRLLMGRTFSRLLFVCNLQRLKPNAVPAVQVVGLQSCHKLHRNRPDLVDIRFVCMADNEG